LRAGPLAETEVIELLNGAFVPVYVSNEDYEGTAATVSADEAKALQRIYHDALREKRAAGSVCVYLQSPDGQGLSSLIVSDACEPGRLRKLLEDAVARVKPKTGPPLVKPSPQSVAPRRDPGGVLLHLVSRYDRRGSWAEFPAENWVPLAKADWSRWLPSSAPRPGQSWDVPKDAATPLRTYVFPQTEVCDFARLVEEGGPYHHHVAALKLTARVLSVEGGIARVRLEGDVRIKHRFYPGHDDQNEAVASLLGYLEFDAVTKTIQALRLVTDRASYAGQGYGVAARSLP
jgi:hypothetical protein